METQISSDWAMNLPVHWTEIVFFNTVSRTDVSILRVGSGDNSPLGQVGPGWVLHSKGRQLVSENP